MAALPASEVLVVGAGPVGLTAAATLHQHGVHCRIVDRNAHRVEQSRAAIVHARTIEVLERFDLVEKMRGAGTVVHGANVFAAPDRLVLHFGFETLDSPFPFLLGLSQTETERIFEEHLNEKGLRVERQTELAALRQDDDGVEAVLRHADGQEERLRVAYLAGCDGGRSTVRHLLGLQLEGETLDTMWLTADVRIDWPHRGDEVYSFLDEEFFAFFAPMGGGRWRIVTQVAGWNPAHPPAETLETVQEICNRLHPGIRLYDPVWISPFGISTRLVPRMRQGRVFLAGDAAHVHSPVGGQGMNTGIQDAFNLGWKIAQVLRGRGGDALLESYHVERHANATRLLRAVGPATRMASVRSPLTLAVASRILRFLGHFTGIGGVIAHNISELSVHCRGSPVVAEHNPGLAGWLTHLACRKPHPSLFDCWDFGKGPAPGERAPDAQPVGAGGRLFERWIGEPRHALLVFPGRQPHPDRAPELGRLVQQMNEEHGDWLRADLVAPDGLADPEGQLHHRYGARYECLYLIRPDGYVGFRSQPADGDALRAYLDRVCRNFH